MSGSAAPPDPTLPAADPPVPVATTPAGRTSFLHAVGLTFAGTMAALLAATANSILVSRALGPEGRGLYALATAAVATLSLLGSGGLQHSNAYWASREQGRLPALFWHSVLYAGATAALLTGAYAVWPRWLRTMVGWDAPAAVPWLVLGVTALVLLTDHLIGLLAGLQRFHAYNAVRSAAPVTLVGINAVALFVFGIGVVGVVAAWAAVNAAALVLAIVLVRRRTAVPFSLAPKLFVASLTLGVRGLLVAAAGVLLLRLDLFLVGQWVGVAAAGFYATAILLSDLALRLPEVAARVLFPTVAGADNTTGDALTIRVLRFTLVLALAVAGILALIGRPLIATAFGSDFAPAYPAMLWLLPGVVALALSIVVNQNLGGRGYPRITLIAPLAALGAQLAVDVIAIPRWGAAGASAGASVGYWLMAGLLLRHFARRSGAGWRELLVLSRRDIADTRAILTRGRHSRRPVDAAPR